MTEPFPEDLSRTLEASAQSHVVRGLEGLPPDVSRSLATQLRDIDFSRIRRLWRQAVGEEEGASRESPQDLARRAVPPSRIVELPSDVDSRRRWAEASKRGEALLRAGEIGVIVVAGGEGTRLQFPHPKGMFPIGPATGRTLFEWLCGQVAERSRRAGRSIPCYLMTSDATHDETVAEFARQDNFGLEKNDVRFFRQGTMPVVDLASGKLLMASRGLVAVSPDGHGGLAAALKREGLVDEMRRRGLRHVFYMQVDNPTVIACDPAFLGFHDESGSELSTKVVAKRSASEKMGVLCEVDGQSQIIEYSDMPPDVASRTDDAGRLVHWAGNTAIHVFSVDLLERLANDETALPFHIARKHVPYVDEQDRLVEPTPETGPPNGCKFEKFIFDALPLANRTLVVQADRAREFNPLKDRTGENSPENVRKAMTRLFGSWLAAAGATVPDAAAIEISPGVALDGADMETLGKAEIERRTTLVEGSGVLIS